LIALAVFNKNEGPSVALEMFSDYLMRTKGNSYAHRNYMHPEEKHCPFTLVQVRHVCKTRKLFPYEELYILIRLCSNVSAKSSRKF
jgi:hypothetical protein